MENVQIKKKKKIDRIYHNLLVCYMVQLPTVTFDNTEQKKNRLWLTALVIVLRNSLVQCYLLTESEVFTEKTQTEPLAVLTER